MSDNILPQLFLYSSYSLMALPWVVTILYLKYPLGSFLLLSPSCLTNEMHLFLVYKETVIIVPIISPLCTWYLLHIGVH